MNAVVSEPKTAPHRVVSQDQWLAMRKAFLEREKQLTRMRDEVARERRELPWVRIDKNYVFDTVDGKRSLADLFDGRSQLLVQHFMFGPGWEQGCRSCSFMADHNDSTRVHLAHRDTTLIAVSRGPLAELEAFRKRMGWQFKWASSQGSDFNYDFAVSFTPEQKARGEASYNYGSMIIQKSEEMPGISAFFKDESGDVFHTYSTYGRGVEVAMHTYALLDLTAKGRDEVEGGGMAWLRHHDRYGD